jgi:hypothetical protein
MRTVNVASELDGTGRYVKHTTLLIIKRSLDKFVCIAMTPLSFHNLLCVFSVSNSLCLCVVTKV